MSSQRETIERLHALGWSTREIAAHRDVTVNHARVHQMTRNLERPLIELSELPNDSVLLTADGLSAAELAETVTRALERNGRKVRRADLPISIEHYREQNPPPDE